MLDRRHPHGAGGIAHPMAPHSARGLRAERIAASKLFRDERFHNPSGATAGLQGSPLPLLGEWMFSTTERRPPRALPTVDPRPAWLRAPETGFRATWLGHSTVLLEFGALRVLTDPVFAERIGPVSFAGPRRFHPTPVPLDALPPVDLVVLSHDHYDHLCASTMAALARSARTHFATALGVGARLEALGVDPARITELDWHERASLCDGRITVTAAPSQHFSGRSLTDRNRTLWASWVIECEGRRVFFSGDTGLFDGMRDLGAKYGPFDLTMLEVGAFHPAWGTIHLGPDNALDAHRLLGGGRLLPVHWGTFDLALHAWDDPAEKLLARSRSEGLSLLMPQPGEAVEPARVDPAEVSPWWRAVNAADGSPSPAATPAPGTAAPDGA